MNPIKLFIVATTISLGSVREEGGVVSHTFYLRNDGVDSIRIANAWTSCHCTTAEYDATRWIGQGDSIPVDVIFNMQGKSGEFLETATVQVVSRNDTINQALNLEGEVIPSASSISKAYPVTVGKLRLSTTSLDFGQMKRGETKSLDIAVYGHPAVSVSYCADKGWGEHHVTRDVNIGNTKVKVAIKSFIIDNATGGQKIKTARRLPSGSRKLEISNIGNELLIIHRVCSAKGDILSKDMQIAPGKSVTLNVSSTLLSSTDDTQITIISNDPHSSRLVVRIMK